MEFIIPTCVLFWRRSMYPVQCTGAVAAPGPGVGGESVAMDLYSPRTLHAPWNGIPCHAGVKTPKPARLLFPFQCLGSCCCSHEMRGLRLHGSTSRVMTTKTKEMQISLVFACFPARLRASPTSHEDPVTSTEPVDDAAARDS